MAIGRCICGMDGLWRRGWWGGAAQAQSAGQRFLWGTESHSRFLAG